jgi:branched-chain amino acid transport system ATP-binding protein
VLVRQIGDVVRGLKERGLTILLVEQNVNFASSLADRQYVIENGIVVDEIARAEFATNRQRLEMQLGI